MGNSRTKSAKRNLVTGFISKGIMLILPFMINSIIIRKLGTDYIGLGSLFNSILNVLNMAELGFTSAVVFSLYKPLAMKDTEHICALMNYYKRIYNIIGYVIIGLGIIIMPFLPLFIKGEYPSDINLYYLFIIFLLNTSLSYIAYAYKGVLLTADQRQDIINNITSILTMVKCGIQIVILLILKNYYAFIVWNLAYTLAYNIFIAIVTKKRYPDYFCNGKITAEEKRRIGVQIKGLALSKISKTARNSFDAIALSMFFGLFVETIYSNYYLVFSGVHGFLVIIISSITAGVGNSLVTENADKNHSDFLKFNFYYGWISSWCTICMLCLYQDFMKLWVGEKLLAPQFTMILFCIYFYISQIGQIRSVYSGAAGLWWEFRWLEIGELILNPVLNFVLAWNFGMDGILWATIITVFVFSIIGVTKLTYKLYFKRSSKEYFMDILYMLFITLIVAFLTMIVCNNIKLDNLAGLFVKTGICIVMPNILFVSVFAINNKTRKYIKDLVYIVKR